VASGSLLGKFTVTGKIAREPNWMISSGGYGGGRDYSAVIN